MRTLLVALIFLFSSVDESRADLKLPRSGTYKTPAPAGSVATWNWWYYDRLTEGTYRIRALSGDGKRPSRFDNGTTVSETEMFRRLVAAGELVPESCSTALDRANSKIPSRGNYKTPAPAGSVAAWNYWVYDYIGGGNYRIRNASLGSPARANALDHGTVVGEEEMFRLLVEAGVFK